MFNKTSSMLLSWRSFSFLVSHFCRALNEMWKCQNMLRSHVRELLDLHKQPTVRFWKYFYFIHWIYGTNLLGGFNTVLFVQCNFVIRWFLYVDDIPFSRSKVAFCNAWRHMTSFCSSFFIVLLKNFGISFKISKVFVSFWQTFFLSFLPSKGFWK